MPLLYALTLGLGAFLLFSAQPMIAKMVLPLLGGTPAVWTTCMLFFQGALLAGYLYAHATTRLGVRGQSALHLVLLALPLFLLPIGIAAESAPPASSGTGPAFWLLGRLLTSAGLPLFVVATTAPLLQRWFSETGHRLAGDPYFLYGASNLGSLLALLSYPFVIEPGLPLARQAGLWASGYVVLAVLTLACAAATRARARPPSDADVAGNLPRPGTSRWLRWAWLAAVPSSLMLGVTTYLSTDIAPVPLLWVVPLALYLATFVLTFARRPLIPHSWMVRALPPTVMALAVVLGFGLVQPLLIPLHLFALFAAAMVGHGELARGRPPARDLTAFYLAIAVGGVLGGAFNALVAPRVFDRIAEYPLALVLACLALPGVAADARPVRRRLRDAVIPAAVLVLSAVAVGAGRDWADSPAAALGMTLASGLVVYVCWTHRTRPVRFALGIGAALLATGLTAGVNGRVLHQERNFFGVLQVTEDPDSRSRRLFHGRTLHGQQSLDPARRREPLAYFHRTGPVGQVFERRRARPAGPNVAVFGLGAGTLACYAEPAERWTFYEIDPAVVRIATDPRDFTFLSDCRAARLDLVLGDARLRLRDAPDHGYGLLVLDAFSADALPVHLLTREALRLYLDKLAPGGLLAFHISNRYLDLDPVVGALARDAGLACRVRYDVALAPEEARAGKQKSIWAVVAAEEANLGALADDPRWRPARPGGWRVWTDDFSDPAAHFIVRRR